MISSTSSRLRIFLLAASVSICIICFSVYEAQFIVPSTLSLPIPHWLNETISPLTTHAGSNSSSTVPTNASPELEHEHAFRLSKNPITIRQCDVIPTRIIHHLALTAALYPESNPVVFHFHNGEVIGPDYQHFTVGDEFCSIVFAPQNPRTNLSQYQNLPIEGWGPDSIHAEIASADVRLVFEHPDFYGSSSVPPNMINPLGTDLAIYTIPYVLNHPGFYQITGEVDFQNYDWVMEDPIDMSKEALPYVMLTNTFDMRSPPIIITGIPISRPMAQCYTDGSNDLRGRWYRAASFNFFGNQTGLNPAAWVEFSEHNNTVDEWGWTFAPDACSLTYYTPSDHIMCLGDRTIQVLGDSNSRRMMKSIMGGGISWCNDPDDRECQCEDQYEEEMQDVLWRDINITNFRDINARQDPIVFGRNTKVYFDFIGGLLNQAIFNGWTVFFRETTDQPSVVAQRQARHGDMDIVHLSTVGWDVASVRTPSEIQAVLPSFRKTFLKAYPTGTRFVTRLANSLCCGNQNQRTRYSAPRFKMYNQMWRNFWAADEAAELMRVVDASVLQGRRDAETRFYCPTTHMRSSHVRLEQMMWMGAVCEKQFFPNGQTIARMRERPNSAYAEGLV